MEDALTLVGKAADAAHDRAGMLPRMTALSRPSGYSHRCELPL